MTLKEFVIQNIKADDYYASRFPEWNPLAKSNVRCPFHDDGARGNLAISLRNGGAKCHSSQCARSFGNIVHFEAERLDIGEYIATKRLYREFIRKVVPSKLLANYRSNLQCDPNYMLKIKKEMGLTLTSVNRFQLGLDADSHRITIPIYDQFQQCINVRFYRLPSERTSQDSAKLYNLKGYGGIDLFPYPKAADLASRTPLCIMASEKEAMLAIQDGYFAVSSTSGEGSWNPEWNFILVGRQVFHIFDRDAGGEAARKRLVPMLETVSKSVKPIILPFKHKRGDWKDYADFRLREKRDGHELGRLIRRHEKTNKDNADRVRNGNRNHPDTSDDNEVDYPALPSIVKGDYDISSISSRHDLLNKRIRTEGIVAAKSPNTYSIPWKFRVVTKGRPPFTYELPMSRELLRYIRSSDSQILQSVQKLVGAANAEVTPIAYLTATEVEVIPTATIEKDAPYVVQRCFYFGQRIEANVPYSLEIIPTSEIRSQETIGIITSLLPLSKSVDRLDTSADNIANLSIFQPTEGERVWDKLVAVANEVTERHTRIYNRLDWTIIALLSWASPIGYRFPNEPSVERGWLNSLVVGDTETGKSKVALRLKGLFQCGSFVSGENCTFVGLVGGAIKMGSGQLMLRWGRIPLNDKQLVILEELSGLSVEDISNMSDVRSSGMARLDKGGINSETNCRTRLICLSNARSKTRPLSSYLFGVHAIQELIGHGEDIARFDLITTLTDNEVSNAIINSPAFVQSARPEEAIAKDQFQKLIHFIWALTPEQIYFSQASYEECLSQTQRLASIYHPSVPIFKGGSGRHKLGRISAAIACFQFSWTNDRIEVTKEHVRAAARLLELVYNKRSFGYLEYSKQLYDRERVKDEVLLRKTFRAQISKSTLPKVIETLIHVTRFSKDELCAIASTTVMHADQLLGVMLRERAIRKGDGPLWDVTPAGRTFFENFLQRLQK